MSCWSTPQWARIFRSNFAGDFLFAVCHEANWQWWGDLYWFSNMSFHVHQLAHNHWRQGETTVVNFARKPQMMNAIKLNDPELRSPLNEWSLEKCPVWRVEEDHQPVEQTYPDCFSNTSDGTGARTMNASWEVWTVQLVFCWTRGLQYWTCLSLFELVLVKRFL